ncbi:FtsK/SpoIIIE domain-containing protein [Escherichia coli]|uniref:FtsK/SpoIIIE domain-containing protein n=1 Tax=Escherichia coli TaxID=562 RepID=UPI000B7FA89D|nr:FtsK/SpoIIIE domain-containing protein [Escherichia coli]EFA5092069.1 DNA translocase FtsK [Escherichia coli]EFB3934975.1 DNA translocase FtsK [Escherichia coli]EFF9646509.1 DNA translocase FtsK [Escherichia coli]EHP7916083.1 DNA translocase FtsK [Escherichia coli]EIJ7116275.1 DNA translocase FtsK [Escherichia coli]
MTRNELIAAITLDFIKYNLDQEPDGTIRFCMVGLEQSLVRSIAEAVLAEPYLSDIVTVRIPRLFDPDNTLPANEISDESITHWRHCRLQGNIRAVLFAASQEELQRNDKSVEKVTKIETDTLRTRYDAWIDKVGLTSANLDENMRKILHVALQSANNTHVARTIEIFADFVLSIAEGIISDGLTVQKAVDNALPSLKLPRYSGYFDRIPIKKRHITREWEKIFRGLHTKIRPLLVQQTEKGEYFSREQLYANYKGISERLTEIERGAIENFLNADLCIDDWSDTQKCLVELDWRNISEIFDDLTKTSSISLGEETIKFFEDEYDDFLEEDEKELLLSNFPKEPSENLQGFYEAHREHLSRDKKLSGKWERYVYCSPKTYHDFLIGLLDTLDNLRRRVSDDELVEKKLSISIPNSREKSFWRGKNPSVVRYFAFRYKGLQALFADKVTFDFGKLMEFYFPKIDDELAKVTSGSKEARSIKFEVVLDPNGVKIKLVFYWEMPVDAIATAMPDDLLSIANQEEEYALLSTADIARQSVNAKGSIQRIALNDVNTIRDVTNSNNGKLVAPNKDSSDRGKAVLCELRDLTSLLGIDATKNITERFHAFRAKYTEAIRDWVSTEGLGISSEAFVKQAVEYDRLLGALLDLANNDLAREKIWVEIIRVGVANVSAGSPAAIITPWHPLRLAEINIKAIQVSKLIIDVLDAAEDDIFRADILFSQARFELQENYYPEICIGFALTQSVLLSAVGSSYDYTLAESPLKRNRQDGDDSLDTEPSFAAKAFSSVGEQYLKLLPHERSNFSVILYNTESKALPSALASELSSKVEQENQLQCDLLLTHTDPKRIRRIYEQQNATVNEESGSVMSSEASRNFLSRLRVGFLDTAKILDDSNNGRIADLVALQDVVARNAQLVWKRAPGERYPELITHIPARWSRRRPINPTDTATSVYLVCPVQPQPCQSYLNLIHGFLQGDNALPGNVVPAREINLRNGDISSIFTQTHKIGEWVVNFDELVDRRLLSNNGVRVIRHIRDKQIDRNIVVSTTSKSKLLRVLIKERLDRLDSAIVTDEPLVIDKFIDQANILSGQVVMRAARYGQYANELLGIVLSMEEIRKSIGNLELPIGWFFLDDYASWFGQREEQIADIMAIAPRIVNGEPVLKVAISEAKFVSSSVYKTQAKKSAKQLEDTVARIGRAIDPNRKRIDRDIWLNRIGDFMIEGIEPFDSKLMNGWDLHKWSDEVRQDNIPIQLIGLSHIFVHDDDEYVDSTNAMSIFIKGMPHCAQLIFDKSCVVGAIRDFAKKGSNPLAEEGMEKCTWRDALVSRVIEVESSRDSISERCDKDDKLKLFEFKESQQPKNVHSLMVKIEGNPDLFPSLELGELGELDELCADSLKDNIRADALEELLAKWPSKQLAEWVSNGILSEEDDENTKAWLDNTVKVLQRALRGYEMTAELLGARLTPNAALIRFRGSDDLTVPKVEKKRQELLTSHAVDVINVLAAPMEIIIMVKRPYRAILRLQDLWRRRQLPLTAPNSNTSLLLGARETDGELLYLNVSSEFGGHQQHGPHTLIAGETGSGKGVLVQSLLLDICATNSPEKARIRMIDPKAGIDFPWLRNMPHLDGDLITERDEAVSVLEELVAEMERRNRLLAEAGVTKLDNYNSRVPTSEQLPRIWLFHDELADWMMIPEYRDAIDLNASRLGVKARAAGINLVLITQRPDKDALPMQLRANLTNRLVLKVADKKNSILVLDEPGAEKLLGRGHMAAKLSGEGRVILAQVPFASESEIAELANIIQKAWE